MLVNILFKDKVIEQIDFEDIKEYLREENPFEYNWDNLKHYLTCTQDNYIVEDYIHNRYYYSNDELYDENDLDYDILYSETQLEEMKQQRFDEIGYYRDVCKDVRYDIGNNKFKHFRK